MSVAHEVSRHPVRRGPRPGRRTVIGAATVTLAVLFGTLPAAPASEAVELAEIADVDTGEASLNWPDGAGAGAVRIDGVAEAALRNGSTDALPMASIAKLLAAAVVLDARPLRATEEGPRVTIGDDDMARLAQAIARGASVMPMRAGDSFTQRELLDAAMLTSSANAIDTLVIWAFGSRDAYLAAAQRWMQQHNVTGVTPADASGLSMRNVATAEGLLTLMAAVDTVPTLLAITQQQRANIPGVGVIENTNGALGSAGIDSGKTGALNRSGRTVLVGATREVDGVEVRVHAVLLGIAGGIDRDQAIIALVDRAVANLSVRDVAAAGTTVASYATPWGHRVRLETARPLRVLLWAGAELEIVADAPDRLPQPGDLTGSLSVRAGDTTASTPLQIAGITDPTKLAPHTERLTPAFT